MIPGHLVLMNVLIVKYIRMESSVKIIQGRHSKFLDFKDADVTDGMNKLMEILLSGEKHVICKNLDISKKGVLSAISESVDRCYKERYPKSLLSPELELYEPCGDMTFVVSLNRKLKF